MEELKLAYIDPGSGSFLVQALVATAAGIAVVGRRYWAAIKAFLTRTPREEGQDESEPGSSE